ncbi:hypothetical protein EDD16DRAFT_1871784 [Pisolithus croceorrhizus]|nr:hypothetical protein EDD16DRAFT_1871784 [Pisolithus croceorrhizus]
MALQTDFKGNGSGFAFIHETSKDEHTYTRRRGRVMRGTCTLLWDKVTAVLCVLLWQWMVIWPLASSLGPGV